ncbi:endonuclease/exonuclease/phosphatase family protein [Planctomycetota bacterium]|nr:endonuclease/exonuclease/phosphatase family protein [Planctomycetota bacterium]
MKKKAFVACLALSGLMSIGGCAGAGVKRDVDHDDAKVEVAEHQRKTVRVMTYNIHFGTGLDGELDLERIANVIKDSDADLVALQEIDKGTKRTGGVDMPRELQKLTGMYHTFGKTIDYQGGEYGLMLLSKWPIYDIAVNELPYSRDAERRVALSGLVNVPGMGEVRLVSTHLQWMPIGDKHEQAKALNRLFANSDVTPVILGGDFNAGYGSPTMSEMLKFWQVSSKIDTGMTFPADKPNKQIDHVMTSGAIRFDTKSIEVIDEQVASDHLPVVVDLELIGGVGDVEE